MSAGVSIRLARRWIGLRPPPIVTFCACALILGDPRQQERLGHSQIIIDPCPWVSRGSGSRTNGVETGGTESWATQRRSAGGPQWGGPAANTAEIRGGGTGGGPKWNPSGPAEPPRSDRLALTPSELPALLGDTVLEIPMWVRLLPAVTPMAVGGTNAQYGTCVAHNARSQGVSSAP